MLKEKIVISSIPSIKSYDYIRYSGNIRLNKTLEICTEGKCY